MKNKVFTLLLVLKTVLCFSQELIPVGEYSNSGYVDSLVWLDLNDWERQAYLESLSKFDIDKNNVIWVSAQTQRNLIKDGNYYSAKCLTKFSKSTSDGFVEEKGTHSLERPECIVFIYRENGLSTVKLVVYN